MLQVHITLMRSGSGPFCFFHSDADPDNTFQFDADAYPDPDMYPDHTTHFFPDLDPPMLQNDPSTFSL